jgi:hypothetical protein
MPPASSAAAEIFHLVAVTIVLSIPTHRSIDILVARTFDTNAFGLAHSETQGPPPIAPHPPHRAGPDEIRADPPDPY